MTVVKIGGAFVAARELESVVVKLRERYGRHLVFVAGGGEPADLVRKWDHDLQLGSFCAHWLAIRAMSLQADLLSRRLDLPLVEEFAPCCNDECVLDLRRELSRTPNELPAGWHVTSDSLAAWAARRLKAKILVLTKAVGDRSTSVADATSRGWVDAYFAEASRGLVVEWFNPNAAD